MRMKITDISHEIFTELGSPTNLSVPAIAFWIRTNVGTLNNLINTSFVLNASHEIEETVDSVTTEIGRNEVSILKKMVEEGKIDKDEITVCYVTGNGLKATESIMSVLTKPQVMQADVAKISAVIG